MLKVFLVEDEFVVRKGIKENIAWEKEGFIFCGEAPDGELAYPLIQREKPDIIITDIRMPFMNGLELSRLIREELPQSKIIILSGHEEFGYAQAALKLGVAEYILKPVNSTELMGSIKQIERQIIQEREEKEYIERYRREMKEDEHAARYRLFNEIIAGALPLFTILERGRQLNLELSVPYFQVVLFKYYYAADSETNESAEIYEEVQRISASQRGVILFDRAIEGLCALITAETPEGLGEAQKAYVAELELFFASCENLKYFGGVGKPVSRLTSLAESFESAARAFSLRFIVDGSEFAYFESIGETRGARGALPDMKKIGEIDFKRVEAFLKSGEKRDIPFFIEEFLKSIGSAAENSLLFQQYVLMNFYFTAVMALKEIGGEQELDKNLFESPESIGDDSSDSKKYIAGIFNAVIERRDELRNKRYQHIIEDTKKYIALNYANEELSLKDIAKHVNVSSSHFSTMFSRETGQSPIRYLTEYRMDKAKELLALSNMRSAEVSAAVGYKDPHYFSYLFKKTQNCSPTQYRALKRRAHAD